MLFFELWYEHVILLLMQNFSRFIMHLHDSFQCIVLLDSLVAINHCKLFFLSCVRLNTGEDLGLIYELGKEVAIIPCTSLVPFYIFRTINNKVAIHPGLFELAFCLLVLAVIQGAAWVIPPTSWINPRSSCIYTHRWASW